MEMETQFDAYLGIRVDALRIALRQKERHCQHWQAGRAISFQ